MMTVNVLWTKAPCKVSPHMVSVMLRKVKNQFSSVCFYSTFYNTIVSRCFTVRNPEPIPPGQHSGKEKLPFNRKKP